MNTIALGQVYRADNAYQGRGITHVVLAIDSPISTCAAPRMVILAKWRVDGRAHWRRDAGHGAAYFDRLRLVETRELTPAEMEQAAAWLEYRRIQRGGMTKARRTDEATDNTKTEVNRK